MAKGSAHPAPSELSYEFYREIVEELMSPIEPSMDSHVRYELYLSKLVYLENLQEQCFRSVNSRRGGAANTTADSFTAGDLSTIQEAITTTHSHIRTTILETLDQRLSQSPLGNASV